MANGSYGVRGNNYTDLLVGNRSLIAKLLMKTGGCTRSELAKMSGLSQAAITKITGSLIELGIIEETGLSKGEKGRRTIDLKLKSDQYQVIGIKIGRRNYSAGVFDVSGKLLYRETHNVSPNQEPGMVLEAIAALIARLCDTYSGIIAAGVSVPGPYLRNRGIIAKMTYFPGWKDYNLVEYFEEHARIPIFVEHDANAGALAEWWFGSTTSEVLVHIIASEGIGAGILNNGHLLYGAAGVAGEIGHMSIAFDGRRCECGPESRGCLEQYCSALAFMRDVKEQLHNYPDSCLNNLEDITVDNVFAASEQGDAFAIKMIRQVGFYFGIGIANLINIYNPDTVIISDIMSGAGEPLLESIRQTIQGRVIPELSEALDVRFSDMKDDASLYGAAAIAVDRFLENPLDFLEAKD